MLRSATSAMAGGILASCLTVVAVACSPAPAPQCPTPRLEPVVPRAATSTSAASPSPRPPLASRALTPPERAPEIERQIAAIATEIATEAPALKPEGLAIAVIDAKRRRAGAYRGDASYYPASVVKLTFLAYYAASREAGRVAESAELTRAVRDMIVLSSNDATGFVVDAITETTSGPELAGAEWDAWRAKRTVVTDWYRSRGYTNLIASQKAFCDDAYGREHAFRDEGRNRNRMTALEAARVMEEIVRGDLAAPRFTDDMTNLLARELGDAALDEAEPETARRVGLKLPSGTRLWSKAGDAYDVRHFVARVVLPSGADFVAAVFTQGAHRDLQLIPRIFAKLADRSASW